METVQRHEWEQGYKWFYKCPHCECMKVEPDIGRTTYYENGKSDGVREEPPCITRTKQPKQPEYNEDKSNT